jgi:tripartite-type tricarboxylate transporter receptor subunit TctC
MTLISIAVAAVAASIGTATAQDAPARPIKAVVPFPPGGTMDFLTRLLVDQIGREQGVTFVVENRPGAGTAIGTEAVSRATPDGMTILMMANSFVINSHLKKLNYDPLTSFEPICYLVRSPHFVVVNGDSPYRTFADLLAAARAKPGQLTLAANGPATAHHIEFEMLKQAAGVDMTFVPYPGVAPALNALLGGHVSSTLVDLADVAPHLATGRLRALATPSRQRIATVPEVPTFAEAGFKDFEAEGSLGVVAPANTPKEAIARLSNWFNAALRTPEFQPKLALRGLYPVGACGADFGAHLRRQHDEYGRIIRDANIKAQ